MALNEAKDGCCICPKVSKLIHWHNLTSVVQSLWVGYHGPYFPVIASLMIIVVVWPCYWPEGSHKRPRRPEGSHKRPRAIMVQGPLWLSEG